jgi:predicted ATPase
VEILAEACGLNPQGGSVQARLFQTRDSEPGLGARLIVERGAVRPHWSYFLRADTMHGLYTYLVGAWHRFMAEPASYFRHLLAD